MSQSFRIGFIGAGRQAVEEMSLVVESNFGEVASVCDIDEKAAQCLAASYSIPYYQDYKMMIDQENLNGVFICVPHNDHFPISMYALQKNLHVIKEKPFALSVKDGMELVSTSKRMKKSILTMMQRRGHSSYKEGKNLLDQIGKVFLFRGFYTFNGGPYDYGWRGINRISGGGTVIDMGYHILDLVIWYLGLPYFVYAQLTNFARPDASYETEDSALITFRLPKSMGSIVLTRASHPKEEKIYIHGIKGTLIVDRQSVKVIALNGEVVYSQRFEKDWSNSIINQLDEFISTVMIGEYVDSSDQMDHLILLESIYRSQKSGMSEPVISNKNNLKVI
jgi:predicted dehydrogenase